MATIGQTRRERLQKICDVHCGGKATQLAIKLGVSKQYVGSMLKAEGVAGSKGIGDSMARRVESSFGYKVGYMDNLVPQVEQSGGTHVVLPVFDARAHMGPAAKLDIKKEVVNLMGLSIDWIHDNIRGTSTSDLNLLTGTDNSMAPTITDTTTMIIDNSVNDVSKDGIYVMDIDGQLFVKRVQRQVPGGYTIISDDERYPPIEVRPDDAHKIRVLGRAVYKCVLEKL
jgi:hypothetical protein